MVSDLAPYEHDIQPIIGAMRSAAAIRFW